VFLLSRSVRVGACIGLSVLLSSNRQLAAGPDRSQTPEAPPTPYLWPTAAGGCGNNRGNISDVMGERRGRSARCRGVGKGDADRQ